MGGRLKFNLLPLLSGAGSVLPAAGDAKAGNSLAVGRVAHLWVAAQMPDD